MKRFRSNKVLGLAIGERSALVAEVTGGERPTVQRLAEFVFPEGVTPLEAEPFGKALGQFLREQGFGARTTIAGLPAKWLAVKSKEVPPADVATLNDILRLQAEGEFSSELKDLVYDYVPSPAEATGTTSTAPRPVLLIATPARYIEAIDKICEAARLNASMILPVAVAVGDATGDTLILNVRPTSVELTAQIGGSTTAIRQVRGPSSEPLFTGELRRAVSALPTNGRMRDMLVWDGAGLNIDELGSRLGVKARRGSLRDLGIDFSEELSATGNGQATADDPKYGPAVALALCGLAEEAPPIDFLHSRLAPPKDRRIPRWAVIAALSAVVVLAMGIFAYQKLATEQREVGTAQTKMNDLADSIKTATAFVDKVSLAQRWHQGDPHYVACLRDLTNAIPEDAQTYVTSLILREPSRPGGQGAAAAASAASTKPVENTALAGQLYGKTPNQEAFQTLMDQMKHTPSFEDVKLGGTTPAGREVSFSITFTYRITAKALADATQQYQSGQGGLTGQNQRAGNSDRADRNERRRRRQ